VHGAELGRLATAAEEAEQAGYLSAALGSWHSALALLPAETRQHAVVSERVLALTRRIDAGEGKARPKAERKAADKSSNATKGGILATIGALLLKFKTLILLALGKGKLLLLGFGKMGTVLTMLASVGVYWGMWGWKFALGFVLCIYVHEMGHVSAIRSYGMDASAPMFIPGFGALIRLRQAPTTPRQDARIGLAGPVWGLGAAIACYLVYAVTGSAIWAALTVSAGAINLFNLSPVWQLDGARGFNALTRVQRWMMVGVFGVAFLLSHVGMLMMPVLFGVWKSFTRAADEPDWRTFGTFVALVIALSALASVTVPGIVAR
jgi:Zn-dependent protease